MPLRQPGPNVPGKWDFLDIHRHLVQIPAPHALGGDLSKNTDGQLPGEKMREGQDVVLMIQRHAPPPTSLSQHAATWPHMGQRQLLMSWHTRSSQPAFIKALGDFRSPHRIWVVLPCLSKLVKQQVVDAFWSTGYGGTGVPLAILILVCLPWSLKW